jgi:hypothetical protein
MQLLDSKQEGPSRRQFVGCNTNADKYLPTIEPGFHEAIVESDERMEVPLMN